MDSVSTTFLGLIAFSALVQAVLFIGLGLGVRRLLGRLAGLTDRLEARAEPALEQVTRVARSTAELSEHAIEQAHRADAVLTEAAEKVRRTSGLVTEAVAKGSAPLVELAALWRGTRRAVEVLRQGNDGHRPVRSNVARERAATRPGRPSPRRDQLGRPHDLWEERQAERPVR